MTFAAAGSSTFARAEMPVAKENIHPVFDRLMDRSEKERLLGQHAICIWLTGLSGSGKSTIAAALEAKLAEAGVHTMVLDGDNVRSGINGDLGFSPEERIENIRRIAEIAKLFVGNGIVTICCFVSPTNDLRQLAKKIIGTDMLEVFVDTPLAECERRDVKGLYAKARAGEVKEFTGISAPFEPPTEADLVLHTEGSTVQQTTDRLFDHVLPLIKR